VLDVFLFWGHRAKVRNGRWVWFGYFPTLPNNNIKKRPGEHAESLSFHLFLFLTVTAQLFSVSRLLSRQYYCFFYFSLNRPRTIHQDPSEFPTTPVYEYLKIPGIIKRRFYAPFEVLLTRTACMLISPLLDYSVDIPVLYQSRNANIFCLPLQKVTPCGTSALDAWA
jgi:hypothetical protein